MIDWLYILILVLAIALIIFQDFLIKKKDKLINQQTLLLMRMAPILEAIIKAQEEALKNGEGSVKVKVH